MSTDTTHTHTHTHTQERETPVSRRLKEALASYSEYRRLSEQRGGEVTVHQAVTTQVLLLLKLGQTRDAKRTLREASMWVNWGGKEVGWDSHSASCLVQGSAHIWGQQGGGSTGRHSGGAGKPRLRGAHAAVQ